MPSFHVEGEERKKRREFAIVCFALLLSFEDNNTDKFVRFYSRTAKAFECFVIWQFVREQRMLVLN